MKWSTKVIGKLKIVKKKSTKVKKAVATKKGKARPAYDEMRKNKSGSFKSPVAESKKSRNKTDALPYNQ